MWGIVVFLVFALLLGFFILSVIIELIDADR
jgi:hypothetical protein